MPFSNSIFDEVTSEIIKYLVPKRCLDIGAGAGKYGRLIRNSLPDVYIVAVEIESDYISKFNLFSIYDRIWHIDALKLINEKVDEKFDVAILGDVIEHLLKSDGVDLIHFLVYRTRYILVNYPYRYLQNSVDGYNCEAHISVWREEDFASFNYFALRKGNQEFVLIEGYLSKENEIDNVKSFLSSIGLLKN